VYSRSRLPGELGRGAASAGAGGLERLPVGKEPSNPLGQALEVVRGSDDAGAEVPHRLGDATGVVGGDGDPTAERAEQSATLVDLGSIRKEGDGRLGEGGVDLGLAGVAEAPLDSWPLQALTQVEGRVSEDDEASAEARGQLERMVELLYGRMRPKKRRVAPSSA
jgi:hypothetical protein